MIHLGNGPYNTTSLHSFIRETFPGAVLLEEHQVSTNSLRTQLATCSTMISLNHGFSENLSNYGIVHSLSIQCLNYYNTIYNIIVHVFCRDLSPTSFLVKTSLGHSRSERLRIIRSAWALSTTPSAKQLWTK